MRFLEKSCMYRRTLFNFYLVGICWWQSGLFKQWITHSYKYFLLPCLGPPEATAYHHAMICLAEGFQALGISFYSNLDYWQTSPDRQDYLFQHNPDVTPNRPIHKFVSQAVQRLQRISLRLFQVEKIYLGRRNQGLSIVPISNWLKVIELEPKIISLF